jgi:hypothetical protein
MMRFRKRTIVRRDEEDWRRLWNAIRLGAAVSVKAGAKVYASAFFWTQLRFCASTAEASGIVPD